jgi:hypothetical protein
LGAPHAATALWILKKLVEAAQLGLDVDQPQTIAVRAAIDPAEDFVGDPYMSPPRMNSISIGVVPSKNRIKTRRVAVANTIFIRPAGPSSRIYMGKRLTPWA